MSTKDHPSHGFLLVDKPEGISSFNCVAQIKRAIGSKEKVGHAGTLDPFASGLLVIGIGRANTRQLSRIMAYEKEYVAQGQLGLLTDTLDPTGTVIEQDGRPVTRDEVEKALASLGDAYEQAPPIYSAIKIGGVRLYKAARSGKVPADQLQKAAEQKKRLVHLYRTELISFDYPYFTIKATVSRGTYVRSLINDIAQRCGTFATTTQLERTRIGPFSLELAAGCAQIAALWREKHCWSGQPFFVASLAAE